MQGNVASRNRYMSPSRFGSLIADLHLRSTSSQDRLLEFFERQRIVVPIARIRWPKALVIEARGGVPRILPTQTERTAVQSLEQAFHLWNRFDADPEETHPLDREVPPGASLIVSNVAGQHFEPWNNFFTNIRAENEKPLYVDAVDTYYHDWQVLLVADALEMGIHVVFDSRRPDLLDLVLQGNFRSLPDGVEWMEVSFEGPRGLKLGLQWGPFFDAAARVEAVRERKLDAISRVHRGESFKLEGAELDDFNAAQKRAAEHVLGAIHAKRQQVIAFLIYLCERWDEWSRRGRAEVAAEYKRQIALAARMAIHAYDQDFSSLAEEVGRPTGHFENTLDVVFGEWTKQAREQAELSLKHSVVARAPTADRVLTLTDADIVDLLDWLERRDLWKVHLSIEAILGRQFSGSTIDQVALAKEVESISTTFEHLINVLLGQVGVFFSGGTLMKKVRLFWKAVPDVYSILSTHHGLVSTASASRAAQLNNISALSSTGPNIEIARALLAAVLYRNDGQHNGMAAWPEVELHDATRVFLTALMFCRKNLSVNPPTP
jgi:hypothetical protein